MVKSRAWSPPEQVPDTRWGCVSGGRSVARARGRTIGRYSLPTFRGRRLRRSTKMERWKDGMMECVFVLLLTIIPSFHLSAQGVLNQFSYDNLRLSGIQLDAGLLGASDLTGSTVGGLRVDYGRIAPKVRLLLGLSYFHSRFDQQA